MGKSEPQWIYLGLDPVRPGARVHIFQKIGTNEGFGAVEKNLKQNIETLKAEHGFTDELFGEALDNETKKHSITKNPLDVIHGNPRNVGYKAQPINLINTLIEEEVLRDKEYFPFEL